MVTFCIDLVDTTNNFYFHSSVSVFFFADSMCLFQEQNLKNYFLQYLFISFNFQVHTCFAFTLKYLIFLLIFNFKLQSYTIVAFPSLSTSYFNRKLPELKKDFMLDF
jgi:hypothetical protein